MKRALAALLALSLLGCFEEELTVALQPDGQGSLRLERTLSPALSRTITDETSYAAHLLAEWRGVVAWTEVAAARRDDGRVTVQATGWFRDANALGRTTPRDGLRVSLERGPGLVSVAVVEDSGISGARLLAAPDAEPDLEIRALALAGFRRRVTLTLPGEAARPIGVRAVKGERNDVAFLRDAATVEADAQALNTLARDLAARVATKALDSEAAAATLEAAIREHASHSARCDVKPGAANSPRFRRDLRAALEAWGESPWAARVRGEREVLGAPSADAPLDPFEPNDVDEVATKLTVGPREGLFCSGEDWYRLPLPAGKRLEVRLEFQHAEGDLDLELYSPDGAARSASVTDGEAASLSAFTKPREVLVRVYGALAPYTLTTRLAAAPNPDAHEPNDSPAAAKPLLPGRYEDLRCDGEDWYRVDVPQGGGLLARLSAPLEAGDLDLAIYAEDRQPLGASSGCAADEVVTLEPGAARTVFVRVFGANATYALTLELEPPPE